MLICVLKIAFNGVQHTPRLYSALRKSLGRNKPPLIKCLKRTWTQAGERKGQRLLLKWPSKEASDFGSRLYFPSRVRLSVVLWSNCHVLGGEEGKEVVLNPPLLFGIHIFLVSRASHMFATWLSTPLSICMVSFWGVFWGERGEVNYVSTSFEFCTSEYIMSYGKDLNL